MKRGIESEDGTPAMSFLEKLSVVSEEADMYIPSFRLGQQFIARPIKEKQPHRNGPVMATHAADALDPLRFAAVVGEVRQRIVSESHASPAVAHYRSVSNSCAPCETPDKQQIKKSHAMPTVLFRLSLFV